MPFRQYSISHVKFAYYHGVTKVNATKLPTVSEIFHSGSKLRNKKSTDQHCIIRAKPIRVFPVLSSSPGAWVTATDLPDILSNLTFNLLRNTKSRSLYTPQVAALTWGQDLGRDFPSSSYHYDYVLAADVVYHHDFLEELLETMRHFCQPGSRTTLLWANKIRFQSDLRFTESFKSIFNTTLLAEFPEQEVSIYKATAKE